MSKFNFGNVAKKNVTESAEIPVNQPEVKEVQKEEIKQSLEENKVIDIKPAAAEKKKENASPKIMKDVNAVATEAVKSLLEIEKELNDTFVERTKEIRMLTLALVSGTNAFMHGKPGTGKSALVEAYSSRIKYANYFRWLFSKTTEPGEIFGPTSIEAMKQDIFKYNTKGKLPEAHIFFGDEIFKANSAILNSLLTIINEKYFFNDGVQKVPLISMIGASNEFAEDDSLLALYDRFLLRWNVEYINDNSNKIVMLERFLRGRNENSIYSNSKAVVNPITTIDVEALKVLNEKVKEITCNKKILQVYNKLLNNLSKQGIEISDRRKNESLKVVQANALLNGRSKIELEDLESLIYTLWNKEEDIQIVYEEVNKVSNPVRDKLNNYSNALQEYQNKLNSLDANAEDYDTQKIMIWTDNFKNIKFAQEVLDKLAKDLEKDGKASSQEYLEVRKLIEGYKNFVNIMAETIPSAN